MSSSTILNELCRPNPNVDNTGTLRGTNSRDWPAYRGWAKWQDFTAETLYGLYQDVVDREWHDPPAQPQGGTAFDLEIFDEDTLDHHILSRFVLPPVNEALNQARRVLGKDPSETPVIGRGGRSHIDGSKPDWAICSKSARLGMHYHAFLIGDTKTSKKWSSSGLGIPKEQWGLPIRQITHYCNRANLRYGFIVTEAELVVLRFRREEIGPGTPPSRPKRDAQPLAPTHARHNSGMSDVSWLTDSLQRSSISGHDQESSHASEGYQPSVGGTEIGLVEYQAIPWANHGDGRRQLTVRLGLFYLALMAAYGHGFMDSDYPPFDSWS